MRSNVKWTNRDGSPGNGTHTMSEVDQPPTADREIPVVVSNGSVLTLGDLSGTPLIPVMPIPGELARLALEAGYCFI